MPENENESKPMTDIEFLKGLLDRTGARYQHRVLTGEALEQMPSGFIAQMHMPDSLQEIVIEQRTGEGETIAAAIFSFDRLGAIRPAGDKLGNVIIDVNFYVARKFISSWHELIELVKVEIPDKAADLLKRIEAGHPERP
jgi:hypothetical protein